MMKRVLLIALCMALLMGTVGCGRDAAETPSAPTTTTTTTTGTPQYVLDEQINRFILAFKQQQRYVLAGLTQNADRSCTAYIDVCEITMRSTKSGLLFSITGGHSAKDRDRMLDIFYSVGQVTDPSCTNSQMESAVRYLAAQTETVGNYRVSNYVKVAAYVPIINLETVKVPCRMEFLATNYLSAKG